LNFIDENLNARTRPEGTERGIVLDSENKADKGWRDKLSNAQAAIQPEIARRHAQPFTLTSVARRESPALGIGGRVGIRTRLNQVAAAAIST
jgi:hypothetical protein